MNLMHENLQVTDGVYGIFSNMDIRKKIAELGQGSETSMNEMITILETTLLELKSKNLKLD